MFLITFSFCVFFLFYLVVSPKLTLFVAVVVVVLFFLPSGVLVSELQGLVVFECACVRILVHRVVRVSAVGVYERKRGRDGKGIQVVKGNKKDDSCVLVCFHFLDLSFWLCVFSSVLASLCFAPIFTYPLESRGGVLCLLTASIEIYIIKRQIDQTM